MQQTYYLCFSVNRLPDLTLSKYSVFDASSVSSIMDKHGVFLRQLHRLGFASGVLFHLLYHYNPDKSIPRGKHLAIIFYATSKDPDKLERIREFLVTSVLSNYYDFYCYEVSKDFEIIQEPDGNGNPIPVLKMFNISGGAKKYGLGEITPEEISKAREEICSGQRDHVVCEIASDADMILSFNKMPMEPCGRFASDQRYPHCAFLTKKDYSLPVQNVFSTDPSGGVMLHSILEWEPCKTGRLFNVLKLMEGYDQSAVLRIDIIPFDRTHEVRGAFPYADTRRRIADRNLGRDDNSENILRSWDNYLNNLVKFPAFFANVAAFAEAKDIAVMLADSVAAEAVESGTYLIETKFNPAGFDMYHSDCDVLTRSAKHENYVQPLLSLYTLEEIRPMFSFPILYPGETVECLKETDPVPWDSQMGGNHESIPLGVSSMGYDVTFPVSLFKKHAFIAGVPGAGKTNTMLYLVTTLWRDTQQHIPFLVLEPAKQEYRALALRKGMEALCVFSPGADSRFPLHINPFEFPLGLTLSEHIANLNAVFAGAFELPPPSPHFIDTCIERIYLNKGWNINERNTGKREYPTLQELYESLKVAVAESHYQGETRGNLQSVLEVRVGSLLKREIGNVYNVRRSIIRPEEWLDNPVIIELEALGEGPANFMSLLISTLIREVLRVRKTSGTANQTLPSGIEREVNHVIFYEEAHNLIGPRTDSSDGYSVDPKISATKFLVKMLAEVRALGEGIVIADQLPSVMAPEVLKNTGLKLGHRLTAVDDRNMLGSTMSASADQLEEQGTFDVGQALIFYEGLMKPFKMRICEWEAGSPRAKYDSPSNAQLFEHLRHRDNYLRLLRESSDIMQEKIYTEFDVLARRAQALSRELHDTVHELRYLERERDILRNAVTEAEGSTRYLELRRDLSSMLAKVQSKNENVQDGLLLKAKLLCRDYNNLYWAYMTMSNNYYIYSDDMYMCTILNYLTLFDALKDLNGQDHIYGALIQETETVMEDIQRYLNYRDTDMEPILAEHPGLAESLFACCPYLMIQMRMERESLTRRAEAINERNLEDDPALLPFCQNVNAAYLHYQRLAYRHMEMADQLCAMLAEQMENELIPDSAQWNAEAGQLEAYRNSRLTALKAVVSLYIDPVCKLLRLRGRNRQIVLAATAAAREELVKLVDFRNEHTVTALSDWEQYAGIRKDAAKLAWMEMSNRFEDAQALLEECLAKLPEQKTAADREEVCRKPMVRYRALFDRYAGRPAGLYEYEFALVSFYCDFMQTMLQQGPEARKLLAIYCGSGWDACSRIIRKLEQDQRLDEAHHSQWSRILQEMKTLTEEI